MAVLLSPNVLRALLLAVILACAAALTAPAARGDAVERGSAAARQRGSAAADFACASALPRSCAAALIVLADEFSWNEFVRFWQREMGSMTGVVGTVVLVAGTAVLIIMSKGRGS